MRRNPVVLFIVWVFSVLFGLLLSFMFDFSEQSTSSKEEPVSDEYHQQEKSHFWIGTLFFLSGLIVADIFGTGIRLIW